MNGAELKDLRLRLGFSQQEMAEALDQHRLTITAYERGFRHKDKAPVAIPRVVELACLALWAGIGSYEQAFAPVEPGDASNQGEAGLMLPEHAVSTTLQQGALRVLAKRGIEVGPERYFFPWADLRPIWAEVDLWCRESLSGHKLHTVLNRDQAGGGIAVLEFPDANARFHFKVRWVGGNESNR